MARKKYISAVGVVLFVVGLWNLPLYGQSRPGFHGRNEMAGGPGMMLPLLLRGAGLTADQKTQVRQIMANHRSSFRDLFSQLRAAQEQVSNEFLSAGGVQESDLAPQVQQISALRSQLAEENLKLALEIRGILTPEQLARVAQLKQQMDALRAQRKSLFTPKAEIP